MSATSIMVVTEMVTAQASTTTALVTSVVTAIDSATESMPAVVVYTTVVASPTSQPASPQDPDMPHEHGLSIGSRIGFIIGLIAFIALLLGVPFYCWRRYRLRRRERNRAQEASTVGEDGTPQMSTVYG